MNGVCWGHDRTLPVLIECSLKAPEESAQIAIPSSKFQNNGQLYDQINNTALLDIGIQISQVSGHNFRTSN